MTEHLALVSDDSRQPSVMNQIACRTHYREADKGRATVFVVIAPQFVTRCAALNCNEADGTRAVGLRKYDGPQPLPSRARKEPKGRLVP